MNPDDILATLRRRVAQAPQSPGIYRWKNAEGEVLYVGKAKNLRNRLKSYVNKGAEKGVGPWKLSLLKQIADYDVTVTASEVEALVLETNLIKEMRPKYNVLMKDDKNYVYVRIAVQEPFPTVDVVRQMGDSASRYFGPFISAFDTRRSLDMLNEVFGWRGCRSSVDALNRAEGDAEAVYGTGKLRPCLDYQIGQCNGTCAGAIGREEYRRRIDQVIEFFKGNYKPVIESAREEMMRAAAERKFEKAKQLRDTLQAIEGMQERQIVSDTSGENADVFGLALLTGKVQAVVMRKRGGKLIGEEQFSLTGAAESIAEVLDQFLPQYYGGAIDVPDAVLVGEDFPSRKAFAQYLSDRRGKKVKVLVPERGNKSRLLELAETNAQEKAKQAEASWQAEARNTERALEELTSLLDLPAPPSRIEGYDISHTGGTETVGSMVVFIDGKPRNDHYRSFTIHSMQRGAVDDYRALREVLTRRLRHVAGGVSYEEEQWKEGGVTFGRARKAEERTLIELRERAGITPDGFEYKNVFVARAEEEIVGCAELRPLGGAHELVFLWTSDAYLDGRLGQFLARLALRSVKKGKVYACVPALLEQHYASIGFRHVIKPPKALADRCANTDAGATERVVMVYDVAQHKPDASLSAMPDLLVIDGGKGQLGVGVEALAALNLTIPVIGLAKREEEVFVPGKPVSVLFPRESQGKFLLMRLRDEAHRFANRHRGKRARRTAFASQLDAIPGIGPEAKQSLLRAFGSVDAIRRAPDEALGKMLSGEQIGELRRVL